MGRGKPKRTPLNCGERLRDFDVMPPGWVTLQEFAKRCGVTAGTVSRKIQAHGFDENHLGKVKQPGAGAPFVVIDWNNAGYNYIVNKPPSFWPKDFKENPQREYKPIDTSDSNIYDTPVEAKQEKAPDHYSKMIQVSVVDLPTAKLREAQLKIRKSEIEVAVLNNNLLSVDELESVHMSIAIELRIALQKAIRDLVRELQLVKGAKAIEECLNEHIGAALAMLKDKHGIEEKKEQPK